MSRENSGSRPGSGRNSPALEGYDDFQADLANALNQRLRQERLNENWDVQGGRLGPTGRRPTWRNLAGSTPEMLDARRIAQFMLERPGEDVPPTHGWQWGPLLVEVQVLLAPDEGIVFISSNSHRGNEALQVAFPDAQSFRNTVREALNRRVDARFQQRWVPRGGSPAINDDPVARRAVKVLNLLSQRNWNLLFVPNPHGWHAEQAIEHHLKLHYPNIARTGPATGTRPPCLGCVMHMGRPAVNALQHYQRVEDPVQAGDYYLKATSGALSQYNAHRVPVKPPAKLSDEEYRRLLEGTVNDLAEIRPKIVVVWVAKDMRRIPDSPDRVTTPEINAQLDSEFPSTS